MVNAELARIGQHNADLANFLGIRRERALAVDKFEVEGHIRSIDGILKTLKAKNVETALIATSLIANLRHNGIDLVQTSEYLKTIEHISRKHNPLLSMNSLFELIKTNFRKPDYGKEIEIHEAIRKISGKEIDPKKFIHSLNEKLDAKNTQKVLEGGKRNFFKKEIKSVMQAIRDGLEKNIDAEDALEHAWKNAGGTGNTRFEKALEEIRGGKIK